MQRRTLPAAYANLCTRDIVWILIKNNTGSSDTKTENTPPTYKLQILEEKFCELF